jgi:hypothetical protein
MPPVAMSARTSYLPKRLPGRIGCDDMDATAPDSPDYEESYPEKL